MKLIAALAAGLCGCLAHAAHAQVPHPIAQAHPLATPPPASVRPGDDFDQYVNGAWKQAHPVPPDRTWIGAWADLQWQAMERSKALLDDAVAAGRPEGVLYASYLDQRTRNHHGVRPLHAWLAEIDATHDAASVAEVMAHLARIDVGAWVVPAIQEDDARPGHRMMVVRQGPLGLPDPSAYTAEEGRGLEQRTAYRAFLRGMLEALGIPPGAALARADAVMALEARLAAVRASRADERDATTSYHPIAVDDLAARVPTFPWKVWLRSMGAGRVRHVNVAHPKAFAAMSAVAADVPLPVVRDYLRVKLLSSYSRYLDERTASLRFDYFGRALRGLTADVVPWRRGVDLVTNLMPQALGRMYVARYFRPPARQQAQALAEAVRGALDARVARAGWLSAAARAEIREKLRRTHIRIGYPDRWPDMPDVALKADDLAGNVTRLSAWRFDRAVRDLDRPIDRSMWDAPVYVPNAYASAAARDVIFPAALLQPPLFDPSADSSVNLARLGATIGHELSHLFDDQGRHYDADGRLRDTWTAADVSGFEARTQALVAQLEGYAPGAGERVNGRLVLGEAMADLAGLEAAHDVFAAGAVRGPTDADDRRFFVAWAQLWRSNYQPAYLHTLLQTDAHPPGSVRLSTVRNLDAWYDAFDIKPGDWLYVTPAERVRIW
jgi:putative endopeptidase